MNQLQACRCLLSILLAVSLAGCGPDSTPPADSGGTTDPAASSSSGAVGTETAGTETAEIAAELAKLSAEDAAAARQQRVCPVSDEALGSMGVPQKVDVNGQPVWVCCDGCKDQLLANADVMLEKLKANSSQ